MPLSNWFNFERERKKERKKERKNWDFLAGKKYILKEIEKKERRIEFCLNCRVRKDGKIGERKAGKMREMLSDRTDDCNCQVVQTFLYLALLLGFRRLHTSRGGGWVTWVTWVTWVATFLCVLFPPWPFPLRSHWWNGRSDSCDVAAQVARGVSIVTGLIGFGNLRHRWPQRHWPRLLRSDCRTLSCS